MKLFFCRSSYLALCIYLLIGTLFLGCSEAPISILDEEVGAQALGTSLQSGVATSTSMTVKTYSERGRLMPTTDLQADLGVECDEGWIEIFNRKDGIATQLGKIYGYENSCFNPATFEVDVKGINVGVDGSSINFEASCNFTSETDFLCHLTVTGGSGRLANASTLPGEPIEVVGTFDASTGSSVYRSNGQILI